MKCSTAFRASVDGLGGEDQMEPEARIHTFKGCKPEGQNFVGLKAAQNSGDHRSPAGEPDFHPFFAKTLRGVLVFDDEGFLKIWKRAKTSLLLHTDPGFLDPRSPRRDPACLRKHWSFRMQRDSVLPTTIPGRPGMLAPTALNRGVMSPTRVPRARQHAGIQMRIVGKDRFSSGGEVRACYPVVATQTERTIFVIG